LIGIIPKDYEKIVREGKLPEKPSAPVMNRELSGSGLKKHVSC
jgi:hypothetical protein